MVYELLQDYIVFDDFNSGFDFFWKYVGILFVVMFLHQYHACLLHRIYWLRKKQIEGV